jgi:hypothetical protein
VRRTCPDQKGHTVWQEFLRAAVRHYAALGVRHWEIWNEPNWGVSWHGYHHLFHGTWEPRPGYRAAQHIGALLGSTLPGGECTLDPVARGFCSGGCPGACKRSWCLRAPA